MAINIGGKYLLKCKIITPLFMGGASQQAELRTQSFNGLLRWWFRVAGGSINDEKRIFGWAGETSNQGLCRIFIKDFDKLKKKLFSKEFDNSGRVRQDKGINYLGFSLDQRFKKDDKNKIQREYLERNQQFEIKISFHPKANDDDIKKFFSSLWLAFNLGNFGSRARRGFGSIKIENIKENENDITNDCFGLSFVPSGDLKNWVKTNLDRIKNILNPSQRSNIPYVFDNFEIYHLQKSAFNNWRNWKNKVQQGRKGKFLKISWDGSNINNWNNLLDFMGFLLMAYRSYRNPDYDNAKSILQDNIKSNLFERPIFGLPLNFFYSSLKKPKTEKIGYGDMVHLKQGNETLRRASPLMIKIIESNNSYEGLFIVMKSTFMPPNSRLTFSNKDVNLPSDNLWKALDDFISTLEKCNLIRRIYP